MVFETFSGVRRTCRTHSERFKDKDKSFFRMRGCEPPTAGKRRSFKLQSVLPQGRLQQPYRRLYQHRRLWKSPLRAAHVPFLLLNPLVSHSHYSSVRLYRKLGRGKACGKLAENANCDIRLFRRTPRAFSLRCVLFFLERKRKNFLFRTRRREDAEMRGCGTP